MVLFCSASNDQYFYVFDISKVMLKMSVPFIDDFQSVLCSLSTLMFINIVSITQLVD